MQITNMSESAAKQICSWIYEKPYDVYNYLSYEDAVRLNAIITQKERADSFLCFWENDSKLTAYVRLMYQGDRLFLGIGLAPDCCGQGAGRMYLSNGIAAAQERYGKNVDIWLQVRSWNKRAIKCYLSCGFKVEYYENAPDKTGQMQEFCFMKLKATPHN